MCGTECAGDRPSGSKKVVIPIRGLHCADCAMNVERSVGHLAGVLHASVSFTAKEAVVHYDPNRTDERRIRKAIERVGYVPGDTAVEQTQLFVVRNEGLILGATCGALLLAGWIVRWAWPGAAGVLPGLVLSDVLFLVAAACGGYRIVQNAILTVVSLQLNVHVLVTTAMAGAIALGYYAEAGTVAFIMIAGEALEDLTVRRSRSALAGIIESAPMTATIVEDGAEIRVPVARLSVGDTVIVRHGDRVPVDGRVARGEASVNEAIVTGESVPVDKGPGDAVYSGTLNEGGWFEMQATTVGDDTVVAQIRRLVAEAEKTKAPVERVVDRFATYFIPTIYAVAAVVFLVTHDLVRAITILVVACPCAFVLATPTAVVAGIGRAARRGIVIRGGDRFEAAGRVDAVLFDKTGTLTVGRPTVASIRSVGKATQREVLLAAATAEVRSEHPLARAVVERAREAGLALDEPDAFEGLSGAGVRAVVGGAEVVVGKPELVRAQGVEVGADVEGVLSAEEEAGRTAVLVARSGRPLGVIGLSDVLRDGALEAVERLRAGGIERIGLITGDNETTASAIARSVGIDEVYAGVLPRDKAAKVTELRREGHAVAMVGDGVNDAPALAAADVGIAMGASGSDAAIEIADIALMTDDLLKVPESISLSRRGLLVIKQNITFAVLYNVALVVLTSAGFISMILGAVLHQLSSTGVVVNSMRLLGGRRHG